MVLPATTLIICTLCLSCVWGLDRIWMANYMDGMREHISRHGLQEFPEKFWRAGRQQPAFSCPDTSPSPQTPTRVDRVRPADVKVVAALGDSFTSAIGANATRVLEIPVEYRHLSWCIGGYGSLTDVITLPNIMKQFNPNLIGFAKKSTLSYKPAPLEDSGLNLADTGANTYEFPEQTQHLINTIKTYPGINYKEDWKVITIFIGGNDLCDYCKNKTLFSVESFIYNLTKSLDMLRDELPRSIVNMVQLLDMEILRQLNDQTFGCILQKIFCSCVVQPKENSTELLEVLEQNRLFKERLEELVDRSGRYNWKRDFAVVLQPLMKDIQPAVDQLQPAGKKTQLKTFSEEIQLLCPSKDHPYIFTRKLDDVDDVDGAHDGSTVLQGSSLLPTLYLLILTILLDLCI